jgi:hypothetical protein
MIGRLACLVRRFPQLGLLGLAIPLVASGCAAAAYDYKHADNVLSAVDRAAAAKAGEQASKQTADKSSPPAQSLAPYRLANFRTGEPEPGAASAPAEVRIIIYTATYKMIVSEVEDSIRQTEKLAAELGGWVQEIRGDSIMIRVPVKNYEKATARVEALGRIAQRDLSAADVTEEYVDLEARLKNALAVRGRLQALLDKAQDVKSALEVEKELTHTTEEIERLQAKLELLKNRVAYSTINVTFERVYRTQPTPQTMKLPFEWLRELDPNRLAAND